MQTKDSRLDNDFLSLLLDLDDDEVECGAPGAGAPVILVLSKMSANLQLANIGLLFATILHHSKLP